MKKIITILLSLIMVLSLTSCFSVDTPEETTLDENSSVTQELESKDDADTNVDTDESVAENEITFEEVVVVDNEECLIKVSELDPDNIWGYTLKVLLENKSENKTYMFSVENAAINGIQCDPLFASDVAAGKKANEEISFSTSTLEENGITEYTDIELSFRVYDYDDWSADPVATETVHIYPYGEDAVVAFEREAQDTDTVLFDNEYATAIVTGYEYDDIWGYSVNLFLVNKTDTEVMFSVDNVSVNGYMADPLYATSLTSGKCEFSSMSWSDATFAENDITEVEEIEFVIRVSDAEDWSADDFVNEGIVLNP